jgi:hypothetical protein
MPVLSSIGDQVLNAARIVSLNPDDGADFEGRIEEDVVWRYAQRAVASLLERGTRRASRTVLQSGCWDAL